MPEIVFQKGKFHQFRATEEIEIGGIRPQAGYRTALGEIIEYDGFQVKVGSGETADSLHLRAAIRGGWFVPHNGESTPPVVHVAAPVVAPPPKRAEIVRYEDQIVATRDGKVFKNATLASQVLARLSEVAGTQPEAAPVETVPTQPHRSRFAITRQEEFEGEGIPIKPIRATVQEIPQTPGAEGVIEDQKAVSKIRVSVHTEGPIKLEQSAQVHKGSTEGVIMENQAVVGTNRDATPTQIRKMSMRADADEGVPVAKLRTPTVFGQPKINATTDVASAISKLEKQAQVMPGTVIHPEPPKDSLLEALRLVVPDFAWDKRRSLEARLEEASKVTDPLLRKTIFIYETEIQDELRKLWPDLSR